MDRVRPGDKHQKRGTSEGPCRTATVWPGAHFFTATAKQINSSLRLSEEPRGRWDNPRGERDGELICWRILADLHLRPALRRSFHHFRLFVAGPASGNRFPRKGWIRRLSSIGREGCFGAVNQSPLIADAEGDTSFVAGSQIGFAPSPDQVILCAEGHHTMGLFETIVIAWWWFHGSRRETSEWE